MKRMLFIMLAGFLTVLFIYYMNKVSLTPMDGLTVDGKDATSEMTGSPETTFRPMDLSFLGNMFVHSAVAAINPNDPLLPTTPRSMGNPDAPVHMYVFSSLTCSHCAVLHTDILKDIEDKYIKTGKIWMVYIDFPADRRGLAGAMLARCVKPENYFPFLDMLFANQSKWAFKADAEDVITVYASTQGLTKGDVRACLSDQDLQNGIISKRDQYMKKYNINATPTIVFEKGNEVEVVTGSNSGRINAALKKLVD